MQVINTKEVENVLLFSSGLDSVLSYIEIRDKVPNLKLVYTPIVIPKVTDYINGEIATIRLMSKKGVDYLDHQIDFFTKEGQAWAATWLSETEPDYIPYRNVMFILFSLIRYPNLKNIYIGGMADDNIEDNSKESLKSLQISLRKVGKNKNFAIKSAFNWELFKHQAIKKVLDDAENDVQRSRRIEFILMSYSSYSYSNATKRRLIHGWFKKHSTKMEPKYNSVLPVLFSLLNSPEEIPSLDRRTYDTKADFRLNVALYEGLGIVFPFENKHLLITYKSKALDPDSDMPKERRKAILSYITKLEELNKIDKAVKVIR